MAFVLLVIFTLKWMFQIAICLDENSTELNHITTSNKVINNLFDNDEMTFLPPNKKPILVKLQFHITGLSHINEFNMEYTLTYYLRITWMDSRLEFDTNGNNSEIILHPEQMNALWSPSIFFRNERGTSISQDYSRAYSYCKLYPNGTVYNSRRLETRFHYEMDFRSYPFDLQNFVSEIASYSYTTEQVNLTFAEHPVSFDKDMRITGFYLIEVRTENRHEGELTAAGTFPRLRIILALKRSVGYYILQVYVMFLFHKSQINC